MEMRLSSIGALVCSLIVMVVEPSIAQDSVKVLWDHNSESEVKVLSSPRRGIYTVTTNKIYHKVRNPIATTRLGTFLIIAEETTRTDDNTENNWCQLTATATYFYPEGDHEELWIISEPANEGVQDWVGYKTTRYGCCGEANEHRLHNYVDGEIIIAYNLDLIEYDAKVPFDREWQRKRYIGVLEANSFDGAFYPEDSMAIAGISYTNSDSCLYKLVIRHKSDPFESRTVFPSLMKTTEAIKFIKRSRSLVTLDPESTNTDIKESVWTLKADTFGVHPTFYIPLSADGLILDRTDFGDYEIVQLK